VKELNLSEVFCEVFSGAVALILALAAAATFGAVDAEQALSTFAQGLNLGSASLLLVGCYFGGSLIDTIGLAAGELFLDKLVASESTPSVEDGKKFWGSVSEHVLKYREHQWAFYSAYRNVFLLLIPGAVLIPLAAASSIGTAWAIALGIALVGLEMCIFLSLRTLLNLYYRLGR
jgi:hypothetical protein